MELLALAAKVPSIGGAMKIYVEHCFAGSSRFMLTNSKGQREYIRGEQWTRKLASEALDLYEYVYKYKRSSIRFIVH